MTRSPLVSRIQIDDKAVQSPFKDGKMVIKVPEKDAPDALAFVVKCDEPEEWFNGPGGDFWMDFKPMDPGAIGKMIINREVESTHWSILERMRLVNENIKAVVRTFPSSTSPPSPHPPPPSPLSPSPLPPRLCPISLAHITRSELVCLALAPLLRTLDVELHTPPRLSNSLKPGPLCRPNQTVGLLGSTLSCVSMS